MNLRSRARKLLGRDKLSEHTVKASSVDHAVLRDLRRRAPGIDESICTPPTAHNGHDLSTDGRAWERLSEDLWSEFFGSDAPALRTKDKIDPRFHLNRSLADKNMHTEQFRDMHAMTRGQTTESALALRGALESLRESYGDELAEHAQRQTAIADQEDNLDNIDDALESLREQRADGGDPGEIDKQIRELADQKGNAQAELEALLAEQQSHGGDLIDDCRVAMGKAAEKAQEQAEIGGLLAGKEAGSRQRLSPEQALEFGDRVLNSRVLQEVLDMLGRMELSMGTVRREFRKGGYEEMVDIEMGNELAVVLPHEKMLLAHPVGKLDFFRRYTERSLMQYEMWSEQELKHGPIIFAADGSDSMRGASNVFCRGLTLAACMIGNREQRNTAAIEFGSKGELREFFFPGDRPLDMAVALDFAEHFFAGGTDINQTLVLAKELIDNEAPFHSADLVIVTDGQDYLTEQTFELRDALRDMGVKIHGLMIAAQPSQYLVEVCDVVTPVWEFAGPNSTSDRIAIDLT